jgi:hypothetical protein
MIDATRQNPHLLLIHSAVTDIFALYVARLRVGAARAGALVIAVVSRAVGIIAQHSERRGWHGDEWHAEPIAKPWKKNEIAAAFGRAI